MGVQRIACNRGGRGSCSHQRVRRGRPPTPYFASNENPFKKEHLAGRFGERGLRVYPGPMTEPGKGAGDAETAILAGGCFWIMQELLRGCDGVISTRVGWTGGENENPSEENNSGHAEAVEVTFDPQRITYRELLEYFFQVHRPDLGPEVVGSSYRSEIFYAADEQRRIAEETIRDVAASGHWPGTVVTEVSPAARFWEEAAEEQDYFQRYPNGCPAPFPRQVAEAAAPETAA